VFLYFVILGFNLNLVMINFDFFRMKVESGHEICDFRFLDFFRGRRRGNDDTVRRERRGRWWKVKKN